MGAEVGRIGQVAVKVKDVAGATAFYRDVLGLEFLFSAGPDLAFLRAGDVRIMLAPPEGADTTPGNSVIYFMVESAPEAHAAIVARGARSEHGAQLVARMPDHELWMAFVRDPEGNLIGLMEERR